MPTHYKDTLYRRYMRWQRRNHWENYHKMSTSTIFGYLRVHTHEHTYPKVNLIASMMNIMCWALVLSGWQRHSFRWFHRQAHKCKTKNDSRAFSLTLSRRIERGFSVCIFAHCVGRRKVNLEYICARIWHTHTSETSAIIRKLYGLHWARACVFVKWWILNCSDTKLSDSMISISSMRWCACSCVCVCVE